MPKTLKKTESDSKTVVETPSTAIAIPSADLTGDFDRSDIVIPSIRQVQKSGELADLHTPGSWVLNQEEVISDGASPVKLIVLKFRKYFDGIVSYCYIAVHNHDRNNVLNIRAN